MIVLDYLDLVIFFQGTGKAHTDIATAGYHDLLHRHVQLVLGF